MASKNLDRIMALLPFFLMFLAVVIGIKSEIDLFSLCDPSNSQPEQPQFIQSH